MAEIVISPRKVALVDQITGAAVTDTASESFNKLNSKFSKL